MLGHCWSICLPFITLKVLRCFLILLRREIRCSWIAVSNGWLTDVPFGACLKWKACVLMPRYTLRCTCTDVPVPIREWLNHYGAGTLRETVITGVKAILRNWNKVQTIYCFCLVFALFLCKAVSPQTSVRAWKDFCPRGHSTGLAGEQCVRKHIYRKQ